MFKALHAKSDEAADNISYFLVQNNLLVTIGSAKVGCKKPQGILGTNLTNDPNVGKGVVLYNIGARRRKADCVFKNGWLA